MIEKPTAMLTIGELAAYAGVTVRAIRHYHERGLLAEPGRDASGYRRYGAKAALDLIRIKTLADAGVPLARIDEVLGAGPQELAESVARIDRDLVEQIRELERRRQRIAALATGERGLMPAELVGFLDELRAAGIGDRTVDSERDGWILLLARYPQRALEWLEEKRAKLADAEFRRLYRDYDDAMDWDPSDPRLEELAGALVRYVEERHETPSWDLDDPAATALLTSHFSGAMSPALVRLHELAEGKRAGGGHGVRR